MQKRIGRAVRPAALYAGVMLTLFPLYYQNYYYDINTCKYRLFLWLTLALAVATGAAFLWRLCRRHGVHPALGVTDGCMAAFVLCAAISCALCADPMDALTGDRGRHSGLLYLLAVGTMTLCLARRGGGYRACMGLMLLAGTAVCLLGVLQFYGVDPLRFYDGLGGTQRFIFMSTIGHINFFGAYVGMLLAVAACGAIDGKSLRLRIPCQALVLLCCATAAVSRSDSVYIAIAGAAVALLRRALASWRHLGRACFCAGSFFLGAWWIDVLPFEHMAMQGLCAKVADLGVGLALLWAGFAALGLLALWLDARQVDAQALVYVRRALYALCGAGIALAAAAVVWFTAFDTSAKLGAWGNYLRLNDKWGTGRGFAWIRAVQSYASFSPLQKLFGCGPDMARTILEPLMTKEAMALSGGVFENCHNEYLQYLLTTGAAGLAAYLAFLLTALRRLALAGRENPAVRALFAAAVGYAAQASVSVNQPITTTIFFVLLAMGLGLTADIARRQPARHGL